MARRASLGSAFLPICPYGARRRVPYIGRGSRCRFLTEEAMAVAAQAASDAKHNLKAVREAYYDKIAKYDMAPLWEVLKNVVTKEPKSKCVSQIWKFSDVKRLMLEAGDVITADEAERRVLVLENPALHGQTR